MKGLAFCHDWLNGMRGGEKCLELLSNEYPDAPIYTLFSDAQKISSNLASRDIRNSGMQNWPGVLKYYRHYLPLYKKAVSTLDMSQHKLIISTSHCVAKNVRKAEGAKHICYCFSPMRYAWGLFDEYFGQTPAPTRVMIRMIIERIKKWDYEQAQKVDEFVAISAYIKQRIFNAYGKHASVIYPPVDVDFYTPDLSIKRNQTYLIVSALVPYKRIDLAIEAFNRSQDRLVIVGQGPCMNLLKKMARSNIRFTGWLEDDKIRQLYRECSALIFPGEEDFGIVPLEAQACGLPVIAYKAGGALETVHQDSTGIFFDEPNSGNLMLAVERFKKIRFDAQRLRHNAELFSTRRFTSEMKAVIEKNMR